MPVHGQFVLATRDIKKGTVPANSDYSIESKGRASTLAVERNHLSSEPKLTIDTSMDRVFTCRVGGICKP
jgi:hypothetical protein